MTNLSKPAIKITELEQVCFVVRDLNKSMEAMWNNFGIGPWSVFISNASSMSDMTYRGKPAHFNYKVAKTKAKLGNGFEIEMAESIEGDNIYHDFLREHGEGIQHIGYYKVVSPDAVAETKRSLEEAGFPCIMSGRNYRVNVVFAYFDTTKVLNTILEVVWRDPTKKVNPDYVFPASDS
jgi:methylmalonyl-CoA/ethylmalonyl-CoA epimerase